MRYYLRHKNIDVARLELRPQGFFVEKIDIISPDHFPYGIKENTRSLREWWQFRIIPATREGISSFVRENKYSGVEELALGSFGLNLSDQYWIVPENKAFRTWNELNFFENDFSDEAGKIYADTNIRKHDQIKPPDLSTSGQLPKRWTIENGTRYLMKASNPSFYDEAFCEKVACELAKSLGIDSVVYEVVQEKGLPVSKCACMVDGKTELIPAYDIVNSERRDNNVFPYEHCVKQFERLGIENARRKIDELLTLDFLIANEDRHYYNFGVVRNADTLDECAFAPIYDSGNSLWANRLAFDIRGLRQIESKPFRSVHDSQIELVQDFSWYSPEAAKDSLERVEEIIRSNTRSDVERAERIVSAFSVRMNRLETIVAEKNREGKTYMDADMKVGLIRSQERDIRGEAKAASGVKSKDSDMEM